MKTDNPVPLDGYQDGKNLYQAYFAPNNKDPNGKDIWVETTNNPTAGTWHMRICVDRWDECCSKKLTPGCISFGFCGDSDPNYLLQKGSNDGEVYLNRYLDEKTHEVKRKLITTCQQDSEASEILADLLGKKGDYAVFNSSCRGFSHETFDKLKEKFNLPETNPWWNDRKPYQTKRPGMSTK